MLTLRKSLLFFGLLGLLGSSARAADAPQSLKKALRVYQDVATLDVSFTQQKVLSSMGTTLDSAGKLKITDHPKLIVWEILRPAPLRIEMTEGKMKIISAPGTQNESVQTLSANDGGAKGAEAQAELSAWINLDADQILAHYSVTQKSEHAFEFLPKSKSAFSLIEVSLTSSNYLSELKLHEASGDSLNLKFGTPRLTHRKPVGH